MRSEGNKIYQMDCLDFLRQQEDEQFDLIVTSPPYNYGGFSRNGRNKQYDTYSDDMPVEDYHRSRYRDWETDRKSTRLNSSHSGESRMPSSA